MSKEKNIRRSIMKQLYEANEPMLMSDLIRFSEVDALVSEFWNAFTYLELEGYIDGVNRMYVITSHGREIYEKTKGK